MEEFYHHQTTWNFRTSDFSSYFSSNCDKLPGQPDPLDSAPTSVAVAPPQAGDGIDGGSGAIIGRLGGGSNHNNDCFHATLLHSPPDPTRNPNLDPFVSADPDFAERAARFSKFGSRSFNGVGGTAIGSNIPRASSCQALSFPAGSVPFGDIKDGISRCATPENDEESSSISEKQNDLKNPRKRKSIPRGKKEVTQIQEDVKRTRRSHESNGTERSGGSKNGKTKDDLKNNFEAPKDYIHVRARRGQATDSHSLAERVRREKISQRMKFLQDLVPGCSKVTGKAVMLDEIINYVQSLQRQVEFLSMKLSTVNPRTDVNMEALLMKDIHQARSLLSQSMFALESSSASATFPYGYLSEGPHTKNAHTDRSDASFSMIPLNTERRNHGVPSMDGFEQSASQVSMWIDELHNVVQMGYGQNEQPNCQASNMKKET